MGRQDNMVNLTIPIVAIVMTGIAVVGSRAVPKGENQTVIQTSITLTITCCTLMWAIVYLAQMHPMIEPTRAMECKGPQAPLRLPWEPKVELPGLVRSCHPRSPTRADSFSLSARVVV